jgi:lysophospholipase L1-like esterase
VLIYILRLRAKFSSGDSTIWEREIRNYEKQDIENPPREGAILFTGSSSIRYWKTMKEDMAPLHVLNRGFGGSRIIDVIHYLDRIVFPYKPKAIVFYASENDLSGLFYTKKKTSEEVRDDFQEFCEKVHGQLPEVPIYFISIKPPKRRKNLWDEMKRANSLIAEFCSSNILLQYIDIVSLIAEFCSSNILLQYIDIVPPMLNAEGSTRPELFKWDGIHMNELGYEIWTSIVKPILQMSE